MVALIADSIGGDEKQKLRNVKFDATTVNGDEATVSVEGATSDFETRKTDGRWYISGPPFSARLTAGRVTSAAG
jgi:hypothetical protein